jgi:metallo-beta-lactamase class B
MAMNLAARRDIKIAWPTKSVAGGGFDMARRILFSFFALAAAALAQADPDYHGAFPAFKIAGNLYYVGTADLAAYLVHTPQGNILINTDFEEDVPTIKASIEKLGFKYGDTKIILISHAHADHDGGAALMTKETGAKLMVMDADVPVEEATVRSHPAAHVDHVLHDGETVKLGGSVLTARLTPGHTKGCTTWTMQEKEGGRTLNVVIVGSPNVNPGYILVGNTKYPQIAEDYVKTFAVLKRLPCDIFLGAHGAYFGLKAKYEKMTAGGPNPFIDPDGYRAYIAEREATFRKEWERQKKNPGSPARKN